MLDTVTREYLAIEVDTSLPGQRVVWVLDRLVARHGAPKRITVDNGPEFTGQALDGYTRTAWSWISSTRVSRCRTRAWRVSMGSSGMRA